MVVTMTEIFGTSDSGHICHKHLQYYYAKISTKKDFTGKSFLYFLFYPFPNKFQSINQNNNIPPAVANFKTSKFPNLRH